MGLIRHNVGITELDVSNCRLGSQMCKDLADAIAANSTIQYLLLDGNPLCDGAGEALASVFSIFRMKYAVDLCTCVIFEHSGHLEGAESTHVEWFHVEVQHG